MGITFPRLFGIGLFFLCSFFSLSVYGQILKDKHNTILFAQPEIEPDLPEIYSQTRKLFFEAVDNTHFPKVDKIIQLENTVLPNAETIAEYCQNNGAQFLVIPKITFFKVGIGKYVFSNQVVVTLKLYNAEGVLTLTSSHDTMRNNARIIGATSNTVRIGSRGALKSMIRMMKTVKT